MTRPLAFKEEEDLARAMIRAVRKSGGIAEKIWVQHENGKTTLEILIKQDNAALVEQPGDEWDRVLANEDR
jgi:hypothetical protein